MSLRECPRGVLLEPWGPRVPALRARPVTILTTELLREKLKAFGPPRHLTFGEPMPVPKPGLTKAYLTERGIQRQIVQLFRTAGCTVYIMSRVTTARGNAGLPDLYVVKPGRGAWWFEVKAPHGRQSFKQRAFQQVVESARVRYWMGGLAAAQEALRV